MTDEPRAELAPQAAPLTDDQRSGRLFLRFNLIALVIALVALAVGAALLRSA